MLFDFFWGVLLGLVLGELGGFWIGRILNWVDWVNFELGELQFAPTFLLCLD